MTGPIGPEGRVTAWTEDGVVMGIEHRHRPIWGVTFQHQRGPLGPGNVALDKTEQVAIAHRDLGGDRKSVV